MVNEVEGLITDKEMWRFRSVYEKLIATNNFIELLNKGKGEIYAKRLTTLIEGIDLSDSRYDFEDWALCTLLLIAGFKRIKKRAANREVSDDYAFDAAWAPIRIYMKDLLKEFIGNNLYISEKCINSMSDELFMELSNVLQYTLHDSFVSTMPFGHRLCLHATKEGYDDKNIQSYYYDKFIQNIDFQFLLDYLEQYPICLYLIGKTVSGWFIRQKELCDRVYISKGKLEYFLELESIVQIQNVLPIKGDLHNNGRRTYILELKSNKGEYSKVCYKPRNVKTDKFLELLASRLDKLYSAGGLKAAKCLDCVNYGFTEYIYGVASSKPESTDKHIKLGRLLYYLWILGANDCGPDNIIFDGNDYILIDCESLFQGSWILSNNALNPCDLTELYYNSVIRTSMIPNWSTHGEKDNLDDDKSFIGNLLGAKAKRTEYWVNINTDKMIENKNKSVIVDNSREESDLFTKEDIDNFIAFVIEGFRLASRSKDYFYKVFYCTLNDGFQDIDTSFIFRDTSIYKKLQRKLFSPECCKNASIFIATLFSLKKVMNLYKDSPSLHWITGQEIRQIFSLDIPSFNCNIVTSKLQVSDEVLDEFESIYISAKKQIDFTYSQTDKELDLQLFILESAIKSRYLWNSSIYYIPSSLKKYKSEYIDNTSCRNAWVSFLKSSFILHSRMVKPELLTFYSGYNRKEIQIVPLDNTLYSGYTGILVAYQLSGMPREIKDDMLNIETDVLRIVENDYYRKETSIGLCGYSGIIYGLCISQAEHSIMYLENGSIVRDYCNFVANFIVNEQYQCGLYNGLCGSIITMLAIEKFRSFNFNIDQIVTTLLSFQNRDGSWREDLCENSRVLERGLLHGIDGILLTLCGIHERNPATEIKLSISLTLDYIANQYINDPHYMNSKEYSWASGFSGHLVAITRCLKNGFGSPVLTEYLNNLIELVSMSGLNDDHSLISGKIGRILTLEYVDSIVNGSNLVPEIDKIRLEVLNYQERNKALDLTYYDENYLLAPSLGHGYSSFPALGNYKPTRVNPFIQCISFDDT